MKCVVCGGDDFTHGEVLSDELVDEWELNETERGYIDRQQGTICSACGCNIRSQALAKSILNHWNDVGTFSDFVKNHQPLRVLEMNGAAHLTSYLAQMPNRILAEYPEVDMRALPYESESFDIVVHSDTLEHVRDPVTALKECRRVLKKGGLLCYTVPTIVQRMTRTREGLPPSYHGTPGAQEYLVVSEYGADVWQQMIEAGFDDVKITTFDYPAGIAISSSNGPIPVIPTPPPERTLFEKLFGRRL